MRLVRVLALIVAGLAASAAALKRALPSRGDEESAEVALVAIFDGVELRSRAQGFTGGSLLALFGGVTVDLREATLAPGAQLTAHALFGGVAIRVPPGWRIESSLHAVAGGVDVRRSEHESPDGPVLTIDGLALFGGIAVGTKAPDAAASAT